MPDAKRHSAIHIVGRSIFVLVVILRPSKILPRSIAKEALAHISPFPLEKKTEQAPLIFLDVESSFKAFKHNVKFSIQFFILKGIYLDLHDYHFPISKVLIFESRFKIWANSRYPLNIFATGTYTCRVIKKRCNV